MNSVQKYPSASDRGMVNTGIQITKEAAAYLDDVCHKRGVSRSALIKQAIIHYLNIEDIRNPYASEGKK